MESSANDQKLKLLEDIQHIENQRAQENMN